MRYITLPSAACPALQYTVFPHYLVKGLILENKLIEHRTCAFILYTTFFPEMFLIIKRTERDLLKNVCWSVSNAPAILFRFNEL
jgi:hypothetical protein